MQEAGVLWVGVSPQASSVPPQLPSYEIETPVCTFPGMPGTGVTGFAYVLHAHKLGRELWTTVERTKAQENAECPAAKRAECSSFVGGQCNICFSSEGCCKLVTMPALCSSFPFAFLCSCLQLPSL